MGDQYFNTVNNELRIYNGSAWQSAAVVGGTVANLTVNNDSYHYGVRVGRGGGAVSTNTVVGAGAMAAVSTGGQNTAVGATSLPANTTGIRNTAIGQFALYTNTTGQQNTAVGTYALYTNNGTYNVGVGEQAAYANTTGSYLIAVGKSALAANTTADGNVAIGYESLYLVTTNGQNVGAGFQALRANTAAGCVGVGYQAAYSNTTGQRTVAIGLYAGAGNTTGNFNVFVGPYTGYGNSGALTGGNNMAMGNAAMFNLTSGSNNVALGYAALYSGTTAADNVAIGTDALSLTTTGAYNVAIGREALRGNTTASNNTAVGYQAGYANTTGADNTFLGQLAGYGVTTGSRNTLVGFYTGSQMTTGTFNNFIGTQAGQAVTTGSKNTILGSYSGNQNGLDIRTANNYIILSDGDGNPRFGSAVGNAWIGAQPSSLATLALTGSGGGGYIDGARNSLYLRSTNTSGNQSNSIVFGSGGTANSISLMNDVNANGTTINQLNIFAGASGGVYLANGGTSWTSYSDENLKDIIEPIVGAAQKLKAWRTVVGKYKTDEEGTRRLMFIAQDIQSNTPEVITKSVMRDDPSQTEYLGVQYAETVPMAVAAINEHSDSIASLSNRVDRLMAELAALKGN